MSVSNIMPRHVNVLFFFYVKKSRSSKAEQLYIQVHGIIVLTNSDWFLDLWLEGAGPLSARPRNDVYYI